MQNKVLIIKDGFYDWCIKHGACKETMWLNDGDVVIRENRYSKIQGEDCTLVSIITDARCNGFVPHKFLEVKS